MSSYEEISQLYKSVYDISQLSCNIKVDYNNRYSTFHYLNYYGDSDYEEDPHSVSTYYDDKYFEAINELNDMYYYIVYEFYIANLVYSKNIDNILNSVYDYRVDYKLLYMLKLPEEVLQIIFKHVYFNCKDNVINKYINLYNVLLY